MLSVPTDVSCDEWAFSLLPLDVDLLSMELPEFFTGKEWARQGNKAKHGLI